jgi:hypothetical protein
VRAWLAAQRGFRLQPGHQAKLQSQELRECAAMNLARVLMLILCAVVVPSEAVPAASGNVPFTSDVLAEVTIPAPWLPEGNAAVVFGRTTLSPGYAEPGSLPTELLYRGVHLIHVSEGTLAMRFPGPGPVSHLLGPAGADISPSLAPMDIEVLLGPGESVLLPENAVPQVSRNAGSDEVVTLHALIISVDRMPAGTPPPDWPTGARGEDLAVLHPPAWREAREALGDGSLILSLRRVEALPDMVEPLPSDGFPMLRYVQEGRGEVVATGADAGEPDRSRVLRPGDALISSPSAEADRPRVLRSDWEASLVMLELAIRPAETEPSMRVG